MVNEKKSISTDDFIDGKNFQYFFSDYFYAGPGRPDQQLRKATLEGDAFLHGDPTISTVIAKIEMMVREVKAIKATAALRTHGLFASPKPEVADLQEESQKKQKPDIK